MHSFPQFMNMDVTININIYMLQIAPKPNLIYMFPFKTPNKPAI